MPFSLEVKAEALIACGRRCCICHKLCGVRMECHHIIPQAKGGGDDTANCIPLCFDCHAEVEHYNPQHPKGNKFTPEELRGHRDRAHRLLRESIIQELVAAGGIADSVPAAGTAQVEEFEIDEADILLMQIMAFQRTYTWDIVRMTQIPAIRVDEQLENLKRQGLVKAHKDREGASVWSITQKGRRFLSENKLE